MILNVLKQVAQHGWQTLPKLMLFDVVPIHPKQDGDRNRHAQFGLKLIFGLNLAKSSIGTTRTLSVPQKTLGCAQRKS
jgi:hypothetical protein